MKLPRTLTVPRPPDFEVGEVGSIYLRRWWVIPRNPYFNIYLHHFLRSDDDRALHDHPWRFNVSILLAGRYNEHLPGRAPRLRKPWRPWAPWRLVLRCGPAPHRVALIAERPVWTIFITGKRIRNWGFHCPKGWVPWQQFVEIREGGNGTGNGCE